MLIIDAMHALREREQKIPYLFSKIVLSNISSCYSASPSSPAAVVVSSLVDLIVPLVASLNTGPNVCPPSVLNLATGVSLVWFVSPT